MGGTFSVSAASHLGHALWLADVRLEGGVLVLRVVQRYLLHTALLGGCHALASAVRLLQAHRTFRSWAQ